VLRGPHQSCWVLKRQRPQQNRINHTKNRCVRTNSERKGQDGNRGETGILAQRAHTVANVLHQRFDEAHAARIAMFLFELFHSAEFQTRPTLGLLRRQAGLDELRDLLLEVEAQFVVKFGLHVFPAEEGAQAQQQVVQHGTLLSCLQDLRDGGGELAPGALFSFQLPAPEPRQLIKLRTAIVFRCATASLAARKEFCSKPDGYVPKSPSREEPRAPACAGSGGPGCLAEDQFGGPAFALPYRFYKGTYSSSCRSARGNFASREMPILISEELMPERGLEPPRPCDHWLLKLACLPVPPLGHECWAVSSAVAGG